MKNPSLSQFDVENMPLFKVQMFPVWDNKAEQSRQQVLAENPSIEIHNHYLDHIKDLIEINNPSRNLTAQELSEKALSYISREPENQGVWIYYPWLRKMILLPNETDFLAIRTSRNKYKITSQEQLLLSKKKVGIIGLSVGHSMAMNFALERSVGTLKLADFDSLELSNMNRIRTTVVNTGLPKTVVAAREIAEIDPYIKVELYSNGIDEDNIEDFLLSEGKLDVLVEECDGLNIKILARQKCKEYGIPVIMETSDRGMIDIERFDLEPNRKILHGLIDHLDIEKVKDLKTSEEKIPFLMPMIGVETMSSRLKASAMEVGYSITTWPQLGTSVMLGGAVLADTYRRMMLGQFSESGRFIVDPKEVISDKHSIQTYQKSHHLLDFNQEEALKEIEKLQLDYSSEFSPELKDLEKIVLDAGLASSGGNSQPWIYIQKSNFLFLFFNPAASDTVMDYRHTASYISLGTSFENARLSAGKLGYKTEEEIYSIESSMQPIAYLKFCGPLEENFKEKDLADQIPNRFTDRRIVPKEEIDISEILYISQEFNNLETHVFQEESQKSTIAEVISRSDRIRLLDAKSHHDFTVKEMRWSKEQLHEQRDGISVDELELSPSDVAGLHLINDVNSVGFLRDQDLGHGLRRISKRHIEAASAIIGVYSKDLRFNQFFEAGRMVEKIWLYCASQNIGLHIMNVPLAYLLRHKCNDFDDIDKVFEKDVEMMFKSMSSVVPNYENLYDVLLFRVFKSSAGKSASIRKNLNQIFIHD